MATDPGEILQQYLTSKQGQSNDEVTRRYQAIMSKLPADVAADANRYAFSQLPAEMRQQLAAEYQSAHQSTTSAFTSFAGDDDEAGASPQNLGKMSLKASEQDPDLLSGIFGKDSPLGGTLGRLALAAIAAYLAKRFLSGQSSSTSTSSQTTQDPTGGLGGLLGGLLGASSTTTTTSQRSTTTSSGEVDLGSLLGGLLGASSGTTTSSSSQSTPDLGDLLGGLLGASSGTTTSSSSSTPDLGDLLGGLLGTSAGSTTSSQSSTSRGSTQESSSGQKADIPEEGLHKRIK